MRNDGTAEIMAKSKYSSSLKFSYNLKGTTIPRHRVSQNGVYKRKNHSPHLLLGFWANHLLVLDAEERLDTRLPAPTKKCKKDSENEEIKSINLVQKVDEREIEREEAEVSYRP